MDQPEAVVPSALYAVAIGRVIVLAAVSLFPVFKVAFSPFKLFSFIFGASAAQITWGGWF